MSVESAFALAEDHYKGQVYAATWGHLAPEPRRSYAGSVLFTHGEYGDICVIRNSIEIDDSPWFFGDLQGFIARRKISGKDIKQGCVYLWTGTYVKFKNGNCRFSGKVMKVA